MMVNQMHCSHLASRQRSTRLNSTHLYPPRWWMRPWKTPPLWSLHPARPPLPGPWPGWAVGTPGSSSENSGSLIESEPRARRRGTREASVETRDEMSHGVHFTASKNMRANGRWQRQSGMMQVLTKPLLFRNSPWQRRVLQLSMRGSRCLSSRYSSLFM